MEVLTCIEYLKQKRENDQLSSNERNKLHSRKDRIFASFEEGGINSAIDRALVILGSTRLTHFGENQTALQVQGISKHLGLMDTHLRIHKLGHLIPQASL